jgi:hypothetical protein
MAGWNVPPFFDPLFRTNSGTGGKLPDITVIDWRQIFWDLTVFCYSGDICLSKGKLINHLNWHKGTGGVFHGTTSLILPQVDK